MINNKGLMLLEILFAFFLLTFLLTGLVVAGLFAIKNTQFARNKSTATKLASEQLERVRVKRDKDGLSSITGTNCNPCYINSLLAIEGAPGISGIFSITTRVIAPSAGECPLPGAGQIHKAVVDVVWGSPTHTVNLNTCFSDWR